MGFAALVADCGGGLFAAVLLDVGQDYRGTFGGGLTGAGEADALGGAGDEDDFVLEAIGHGKDWLQSTAYRRKLRIKKRQESNTEGTEDAQRTTEKAKRKDNAET